jgi:hypothetical protein
MRSLCSGAGYIPEAAPHVSEGTFDSAVSIH